MLTVRIVQALAIIRLTISVCLFRVTTQVAASREAWCLEDQEILRGRSTLAHHRKAQCRLEALVPASEL